VVRVMVASPTEFGESLFEFGVGTNDLVAWEIHQHSRSCTWCGCCTRLSWLFLLEGFPCWVCYEPRHSFLVKNPHTRHCCTLSFSPIYDTYYTTIRYHSALASVCHVIRFFLSLQPYISDS